jgi:histidinol-phosphatase
VSDADRAAEAALRERIEEARPGDAILGEEFGATAGQTGRRWIVDPLDGTKNFVRGVPAWGALIALERDGELAVGVASAPALSRRWWASRGEGAYADGSRLRVSGVDRLENAFLGYDSIVHFDQIGLAERFLELSRRCWRSRGFSDFWAHMLVAEGSIDVAVHGEPGPQLWDLAPLVVIVEEAGGRFTDLAGSRTALGGSAVSSNGLLHDGVLAILGTSQSGR